jgi:hypothetical protein
VATVAFNASPYTTWAPPIDGITNNLKAAKIKIAQVTNAEVTDDSDGFEIEGKLTINAPIESGLLWTVGATNKVISWTPIGTFSPIKIQYSKDNFVANLVDIATVANSASGIQNDWIWASGIPNDLSDTVKLRVSHEADADVLATTTNNIKFVGSLDVTAPENLGIIWNVGDASKIISWDANGTVTNVNIYYRTSFTGGDNTIVLNDGSHLNGGNSYTWTPAGGIPDEKSETCYVRVVDSAHPGDVYSISDQTKPFSIRPVISATLPALGQNIEVGSSNNTISWNINSAKVTKVDLYYSTLGIGGPFDQLISSGVITTPGANSLATWGPINNTISGDVVIKVRDKSDDIINDNIFGYSPSFDIIGKIVVTTPAGGENWKIGTDHNINWLKYGTLGNIKIYYFHDGAYDYINTADTNQVNSYNWQNIPVQVEKDTTIKLVVESTEGLGEDEVKGISNSFNIAGDFSLNAVPGTLSAGSPYTIVWNNFNLQAEIPNAKLEFYDGTAWHNIDYKTTDTGIVTNSGSYSWNVPVDVKSTGCYFKVSDPNNSNAYSTSNTFEVRAIINVTNPTSIAKWTIGTSSNNIAWSVTGVVANVKIDYSKDAGGDGYAYNIVLSRDSTQTPYPWTIPTDQNILSVNQAKIKVSDAAYSVVYATSANFKLKSGITVTRPNASDKLKVLEGFNIEWTTLGIADMGNVIIEFSKTGSSPWTELGRVVFNSSPYTLWVPPIDSITNNAKTALIRIKDEDDLLDVVDDSDSFEIEGKLVMDEPVGSNFVWQPGSSHDIKWIPQGTFTPVVVEYSTNGFSDELQTNYVETVANSAHNTQKVWSWTVPLVIGDTVALRVKYFSDTDMFITSGVFKTANIGITYPVAAQVLVCEVAERVDFTISGSIAKVNIKYSIQGGAGGTWQDIVSNLDVVPGANTYPWTVPVSTSTNTVVKVSDSSALSSVFKQTGVFTIRGGFSFVHPVSTDRWLANSSKLIEWNTLGSISSVYIQYSLQGGAGGIWNFVNDGSPISNATEQYSWTVPNAISSQACIKITDINDPQASKISDIFNIHGAITLTQPNGQEKLKAGQSDTSSKIKWTMTGPISSVDLALSTNGQAGTYTTFAVNQSAALLEYPWSVPTTTLSNNCFIRIRDSGDNLVEDFSDLAFKIMENFNLTSPNGTEQWVVSDPHDITWNSVGLASSVNLKYSIDAAHTTWTPIISQTVNDGVHPWTIPPTISSTCQVRVSDFNDDTDSYDLSDSDFKIQGRVTLISPVGGEKWGCASQQWIRWGWDGNIAKVDIHYYNGSTWVAIDEAQGYINTGEYEWTIPTISTIAAKVRVRDNADPINVYDISAVPFKIMGRVVVQVPNGAEVWYAGSNAVITWTKYGPASFDTVRIDYSLDDPAFNSPQSITTSTPNDGSFDWLNMPQEAVSGKVRIRIAKPDDIADVSDISDGDFRVRVQFTLNSPNGGQKWSVAGEQTITWAQIGNTQGVKFIYYRQGNPAINQTFTLPSVYTTGTWNHTWTIPDFIQNDLIMRVEDPLDNGAFDISDATFKIMAGFVVTRPDASSANEVDYKWYIEDPEIIRWTYTGTVSDVGIYYSTVGGIDGSWVALTSVPASNLQWTWPSVPNQITTQLKVKVGSATDADAYGLSFGMSRIGSKFNLTAPLGAEELIVQDPFTIIWANTGTVSKVDLHYSTDDFVTPREIITNLNNGANGGFYNWTVPDVFSHPGDPQTVKVRVKRYTDDDSFFFDISGNFRIKGSLWVKSPILDDEWDIGQPYQIKWGWKGTMPQVKIAYSTNGLSGPFNPILESYGIPNDGKVANGAGSGGPGSEYTYTWTIPDEATANAVIRIQDERITESDIVDDSEIFHIIGYLANVKIKDPANGQEVNKLAVASNYNINWEWGGSMPEVKITYSINGDTGPFNPIVENYGVPNDGKVANGAGSGGPGSEYTYTWTIPDTISPNCKVRVADPRDETVFSESAIFKIQGAFTLITPLVVDNGQGVYECRWVTNEVREVKWTTFGTIPKVDLVYAKDSDSDGDIDNADFTQEIAMVNGTNINNLNTFNWTIPNERLANPPYYVEAKIRIYDHNDHDVYVQGPVTAGGVDNLKIDYYKITWDIRDLITNRQIEGLTVNDTSGWVATGLASPITRYVPAGFWTAEWTNKDYGPISESYLAGWDEDAQIWRGDRTIYRTMETLVVHIWRAYSEFSYDVPPTDKLNITSWLERDGYLVSGVLITDVTIYDGFDKIKRKTNLVDEAANKFYYYTDIPPGVKLWIGDRLGELRTMQNVINDCAPYKTGEMAIPADFAGFFIQSWSPTSYTASGTNHSTLQSGRVYAVASYMGLSTGATFTTPVSFTVTIPIAMANVEAAVTGMVDTVNSVLDKPISVVSAEIQAQLEAQTGIIDQKMTEQTQIIQVATNNMQTIIQDAMVSFETTVQDSITLLKSSAATAEEAAGLLETTAKKYSWNAMVSPDPALTGDTVTLTAQGMPGLAPVLKVYSWDNKTILDNIKLTEASEGVYNYEFKVDARFTAGKAYTYVVTEQSTAGMVSGSGMVESMSLTTIAGLAAAAPGAERAAKKALDAIAAVEAVLISKEPMNIALTLKNLKDSVDALPEVMTKEGPSARLAQTVNEISNRIKKLGGDEGYDFTTLVGEAINEAPAIKELRSKADAIRTSTDVLTNVFEAKFGGVDKPVVVTSLEPGSVKFRIVALNPSKTKTQKTEIKYYLPAEVKPKDISDTAGLDLEYDSEKSIYYVYKPDLELSPGEMRVFEVEVEDIWFLEQNKLLELKNRTDIVLGKLETTPYYTKAKEIADTIYPRLDEIALSQKDDSINREQHIGIYRQNLLTLGQVKEDIARMEKILVTAGGPPAPEMLAKTKIKADEPSKTMTWIVICTVIIFTGLLAGVLFFTWHRQARISKEELLSAKKSAFPESGSKEEPKENS